MKLIEAEKKYNISIKILKKYNRNYRNLKENKARNEATIRRNRK